MNGQTRWNNGEISDFLDTAIPSCHVLPSRDDPGRGGGRENVTQSRNFYLTIACTFQPRTLHTTNQPNLWIVVFLRLFLKGNTEFCC